MYIQIFLFKKKKKKIKEKLSFSILFCNYHFCNYLKLYSQQNKNNYFYIIIHYYKDKIL